MSLYIHGDLASVKVPNSRIQRICAVGLTSDAILLSCFGKFSSCLCARMGPLLEEYIVYKRLEGKLRDYDSIKAISYYSIRGVKAMVKLGIEMLTIEAQDGIYEFVAVGRYAKFGMRNF